MDIVFCVTKSTQILLTFSFQKVVLFLTFHQKSGANVSQIQILRHKNLYLFTYAHYLFYIHKVNCFSKCKTFVWVMILMEVNYDSMFDTVATWIGTKWFQMTKHWTPLVIPLSKTSISTSSIPTYAQSNKSVDSIGHRSCTRIMKEKTPLLHKFV